jgi:hypothetical protein
MRYGRSWVLKICTRIEIDYDGRCRYYGLQNIVFRKNKAHSCSGVGLIEGSGRAINHEKVYLCPALIVNAVLSNSGVVGPSVTFSRVGCASACGVLFFRAALGESRRQAHQGTRERLWTEQFAIATS